MMKLTEEIFKYLTSAMICSLVSSSFHSDYATGNEKEKMKLTYKNDRRESIDQNFIDKVSELVIRDVKEHNLQF